MVSQSGPTRRRGADGRKAERARAACAALLLLPGLTRSTGMVHAAAPIAGPVPASVVRVIDGDTVRVRAAIWIDQEITVAVRIAGIDAPELFRPKCPEEKARARAAKARLEALIADGGVSLLDVAQGKYAGRVAARLETADGVDLGAALVAEGLARLHAGRGPAIDWCEASGQ